VPKTRHELDRDHKVEEVLGVAERQLLAGGYAALSMIGVARELGVAQNAIYWYFPTRDHLFVAVLRRLLGRIAARKPPAQRGFIDQAVWMVDRLAEFRGLGIAVHERARTSPVVAEFNDEFQSMLHNMLTGALRPHLPEADLELAAAAFMSTVEGAYLRGASRREREAIVRFTLERLTAG
jgi:AcrR family transcriptional regulator